MSVMPWLEMGWNVVNVEYRMARVSQAPAAVEDAQCALRFVVSRAKDYNIDTSRIVVSGESAGGHLALTAGMIPASAGFTNVLRGRRVHGVRCIGAEGGGDHQLVRHHRRERHARRPERARLRRAVARLDREPRRRRQKRVAAHLRARGPAAHSEHPGRCRPDRARTRRMSG